MPSHDELLAEAMQNYALAHHHLSKLKDTLDRMTTSAGGAVSSTSRVGCVREWQDWLAANGPSLKSEVYEGTGIRFTERGGKYTVDWRPLLAGSPADQFPSNTLMKINAKQPAGQRGAPPKIYFLWSSRYDVFPKFGVGPVRPDPDQVVNVHGDDATMVPVPGVLATAAMSPEPEPEHDADATPRYATVEEGLAAWTPALDSLAAAGSAMSDTTKQTILDTLPEGVNANEALGEAYEVAIERASVAKTLLGVVHPPEIDDGVTFVTTSDGWDQGVIPGTDEPEPDRSGWEMVGNHNHLEHPWSPLCEVSQCTRVDAGYTVRA